MKIAGLHEDSGKLKGNKFQQQNPRILVLYVGSMEPKVSTLTISGR